MLFNLKNDPGEKLNLLEKEPDRTDRMMAALNCYLAKLPAPGPASPAGALDEETKKALKSLGYIQ